MRQFNERRPRRCDDESKRGFHQTYAGDFRYLSSCLPMQLRLQLRPRNAMWDVRLEVKFRGFLLANWDTVLQNTSLARVCICVQTYISFISYSRNVN